MRTRLIFSLEVIYRVGSLVFFSFYVLLYVFQYHVPPLEDQLFTFSLHLVAILQYPWLTLMVASPNDKTCKNFDMHSTSPD